MLNKALTTTAGAIIGLLTMCIDVTLILYTTLYYDILDLKSTKYFSWMYTDISTQDDLNNLVIMIIITCAIPLFIMALEWYYSYPIVILKVIELGAIFYMCKFKYEIVSNTNGVRVLLIMVILHALTIFIEEKHLDRIYNED